MHIFNVIIIEHIHKPIDKGGDGKLSPRTLEAKTLTVTCEESRKQGREVILFFKM